MSSLKMKDEVFAALLNKQPSYSVPSSISCILFGNRSAELLVTILSNPHCNPCARMHPRVESLLEKAGEKICVQYIFSSFDESLDDSNKFLIATYLNNQDNPELVKEIYTDWFAGGSINKEAYFNKYPVDITTKEVLEEFNKHVAWKKETSLRLTPTILINGYKVPDQYNLEELPYFTDLKFEKRK